ncbi:MAG: hypothetical protein H0T86_14165 [Gemmatimonadales bacterium]|nr:hypothetical protein [Gemmatimonadales bacterium]
MRVAISLDERSRALFAARLDRGDVVYCPANGDQLRRLARAGAIDVAVVDVFHPTDVLWPDRLREVSVAVPQLSIIGVVEPRRPSLHEAAAFAREISSMGFVSRPDARFDHLARRRATDTSASFARTLLDCVDPLPLADVGRDFALLQALRPSWAFDIPEQAAALGSGRRKLERWFQGPDICSARRLQSICVAGEALFLRFEHRLPDREIAGAVGILTHDGAPSPAGVAREVRAVFGEYRQAIRERRMEAVAEAMRIELRRAHDAGKAPARWGPFTRYSPAEHVLAVRKEGVLVLVNPARELEHPLDEFAADAWDLVTRGATFEQLTADLTSLRSEDRYRVRWRLREWLGEAVVLGLIRRGRGDESVAEGA